MHLHPYFTYHKAKCLGASLPEHTNARGPIAFYSVAIYLFYYTRIHYISIYCFGPRFWVVRISIYI